MTSLTDKWAAIATSERESQQKAYDQLCQSYRAIDEFRGRLLGFLPIATGAGMFTLLSSIMPGKIAAGDIPNTNSLLHAVGWFGFAVTLGLLCYELYAIKKCAALIEAGTNLERSLRLPDGYGQFSARPQAITHLINEPFAAAIIYPAVLAAWTFLVRIDLSNPEADLHLQQIQHILQQIQHIKEGLDLSQAEVKPEPGTVFLAAFVVVWIYAAVLNNGLIVRCLRKALARPWLRFLAWVRPHRRLGCGR